MNTMDKTRDMDKGGKQMKVVTLLGSPRANGNTATLANVFNETTEISGADTRTFMLNKMNFRGCHHSKPP